MVLIQKNQDLNEYLQCSDIIDYYSPYIQNLAQRLSEGMANEVNLVKRVYEFVRDEIAHSWDIQAEDVTCNASQVLEAGHGICCAKSHLLAAVLRYLQIPVGFCYQWLQSDDDEHFIIIHGLNAIYLKTIGKWIRLDARGNKPGVNAIFSIDAEQLAWPVRSGLSEKDCPIIFSEPKEEVIQALRTSKDRNQLHEKWPKARILPIE
jgi:transglutaminase-like putative cysteine protease